MTKLSKNIIILFIIAILLIFFNKEIDVALMYYFNFIRNFFNINSIEDKFHESKKNIYDKNTYISMTASFKNKRDYDKLYKKFKSKNKSFFEKKGNCIIIEYNNERNNVALYANHYYVSGIELFNLLLNTFDCKKYKEVNTSFIKSLPYIPFTLLRAFNLKKKKIIKFNNFHKVYKKHIIKNEKNKKIIVLHHVMNELYDMLNLKDEDMTVALTAGFKNISNIRNNVGIMILNFNKNDTIETISKKFNKNKFDFLVTNCFLNLPFNLPVPNIREKLDCVITSAYFDSDIDCEIKWFAGNIPTEKIYAGILSQITENEIIIHKSYSIGYSS